MGRIERLKEWIDWFRRIDFLVGFLISLGFGRVVKAMLISFTKIPQIWISPIWLISSGLALAIIIFVAEKMAAKLQFADSSPLKKEVLKLGQDIFHFLRKIGPEPEDPRNHFKSEADVWKRIREGRTPYENKLHHGYMSRFRDRVIKLFHELAAEGINDSQIEDEDIDPRGTMEPETLKKIAEHLFLIAARMDVKEASKGM